MSGGLDVLALKEEDVQKFLVCQTHLAGQNADFQVCSDDNLPRGGNARHIPCTFPSPAPPLPVTFPPPSSLLPDTRFDIRLTIFFGKKTMGEGGISSEI